METQRSVELFDFDKMTPYVMPKDSDDIYYEKRVSELLAQNQTREHRYEGIIEDFSFLGNPIGSSYQNSKKLHELLRHAIALKNHLETHMDHNNPDSIKLLTTLQKVIPAVTSYLKLISDLPFDWRFLPSKFRGWKLSYPDEDRLFLIGTKPKMKYDPFGQR
ncbi:hypothetical protein OROMI_029015 [Orobanche minor]